MPDALEDRDRKAVARNRPGSDRPIWTEPSPRRVRAFLDDLAVVDSTRALLLLEARHLPVSYFPPQDVRPDLLEPTDTSTHCPHKGDASSWSVRVGDRVVRDAVWSYQHPLPERADIEAPWPCPGAGWTPGWRRTTRSSSTPATPTTGWTRSQAPGTCGSWWQAGPWPRPAGRGCGWRPACPPATTSPRPMRAWSYPFPIPECPKIENLVCFYNERADIWVDGELQPRPDTPWSRPPAR